MNRLLYSGIPHFHRREARSAQGGKSEKSSNRELVRDLVLLRHSNTDK